MYQQLRFICCRPNEISQCECLGSKIVYPLPLDASCGSWLLSECHMQGYRAPEKKKETRGPGTLTLCSNHFLDKRIPLSCKLSSTKILEYIKSNTDSRSLKLEMHGMNPYSTV